jgi:phosphoribosylanthranilate isomerase
MTAIKICGVKDFGNGLVAIDAGADYLGFIFYPPSHRALDREVAACLIAELRAARPSGWKAVGVFVNEPLDVVEGTAERCGLDIVQLNGEEPPDYVRRMARPVFKAVRVPSEGADGARISIPTANSLGAARILLDANVPGYYGGTGESYDWADLGRAVAEGFLAGGLTPDNVALAMALARPWGVDVSSGVERDREKDPDLITRFIAAVRQADSGAFRSMAGSMGSGPSWQVPSPLASRLHRDAPQSGTGEG